MDDLWRGRLPLGIAFWGFYLIPVLMARTALGFLSSTALHEMMFPIFSAIIACYAIFAGIGTYKSSLNYKNSNSLKHIAQFFIVIGLFSNAIIMLTNFMTISALINHIISQ